MSDQPQATDTPWRRSTADVHERLSAWVRATFGADAAIATVATPDNGMSSETMLFSVDDAGTRHELVARLAPMDEAYPVFPTYDLALQAQCMRLVGQHTTAPVPEVVAHETDPSYLGSEFIVMRRVSGIAPSDNPPYVFGGWLLDASPEQRGALQRASVEVLAKVHAITPSTHDLAYLAMPEQGASAMDQQLGYQRWYYDWARDGVDYPIIERTFAYLEANRPSGERTVLNWGDSRIGNMLWKDFAPVAVLDWEMAAIGAPGVDISWMIFLHRFFQSMAERYGMPGLPGFMRREDVARQYEELSGHPATDLEYYEVFAALRFAIVSLRTSVRAIAYGDMPQPEDPEDLVMHRDLMEKMLDGSYWSS